MGKFLCYDEGGATEKDAQEVFDAYDAGSAAEEFAEWECNAGRFEGDTMDVMVQADGKANWTRFVVDKEIEFSFRAMRLD